MIKSKDRNRRHHARHNEDVCALLTEYKHWDWVVTTAIYAALHYLQYEIFPVTEKVEGKECEFGTFGEYYKKMKVVAREDGRHGVKAIAVRKHLLEAAAPFRYLKETSWSARYNNFQVSEAEATTAIRHLTSIKKLCSDEG